jgi:hypothetical protein
MKNGRVQVVMFTGHRDATCDEAWLLGASISHPDAIWLHGGALGFDRQVEAYAREHDILTLSVPPDYKNYPGKMAPLVRNVRMLDCADGVMACYDGRLTGGTAQVVREAKCRGIPVWIIPPIGKANVA